MRQHKIVIDGIPVVIHKFNVTAGLALLARLQTIVGGSVFTIAANAGKDDGAQVAALAGALDDLVERVEPEKMFDFVSDVLTGGTIDIKDSKLQHLDELGAFDTDPYFLAIQIFKESIKFNFGSFLKKLMTAPTG